jgi:hypothetical protein
MELALEFCIAHGPKPRLSSTPVMVPPTVSGVRCLSACTVRRRDEVPGQRVFLHDLAEGLAADTASKRSPSCVAPIHDQAWTPSRVRRRAGERGGHAGSADTGRADAWASRRVSAQSVRRRVAEGCSS